MDNTAQGPGSASANEPVEGKKKTPKVKAAKPEGAEGTNGASTKASRPRLPKLPDEHVITVLKPNAKSGKSADRFNEYRTGMTVKEYVDHMSAEPWNRTSGEIWGDIRWDTDPKRNLIHVGPTVVDVPPSPPPKEKKAKKAKPEVVAGTEHQPGAAE